MPTLAHNLDVRRDGVHERFPTMTIYWIGDPAHQAEQSDHNPDSRGIVHAIDCMITSIAQGNEIVTWMLSDTRDLEYIIFNRTIWSRSANFEPRPYTGDNPHIDHVHGSGKHGSIGENAATGTGYDVAAEKMTPEGMMDMTPGQGYVLHVINYRIDAIRGMKNPIVIPPYTYPSGAIQQGTTEPNQLAIAIQAIAAKTGMTDEEIAALATQIADEVEKDLDVPTTDEIATASAAATVEAFGKELTD